MLTSVLLYVNELLLTALLLKVPVLWTHLFGAWLAEEKTHPEESCLVEVKWLLAVFVLRCGCLLCLFPLLRIVFRWVCKRPLPRSADPGSGQRPPLGRSHCTTVTYCLVLPLGFIYLALVSSAASVFTFYPIVCHRNDEPFDW